MKKSMATFQVQAAFSIGGNVIAAGQVKDGSIAVGQVADVNGNKYPVSRIEKKHESISQADAGDLVGLTLQGLTDKTLIRSGQILTIQ